MNDVFTLWGLVADFREALFSDPNIVKACLSFRDVHVFWYSIFDHK